jgi:hypothetical protein
MAQYYTQEYWNRSPEERLRAAALACEAARTRLDSSRQRLERPHVVKVVVGPGVTYVDTWTGKATESAPVTMPLDLSADVDHRRQQYLLDLRHYLETMVEYERLQRQQKEEESGLLEYWRKARDEAREAIAHARRQRDRDSMVAVVEAIAKLQLAGDDEGPEAVEAAAVVTEVASELETKDDDGFRRIPSSAGFKTWLNTEAERQALSNDDPRDLLAGANRRGVPATYVTTSGDTLSQIAKRFYGAEHFWRAIYFANTCTEWTNPDRVRVGMTLRMP